MTNCPRANIRGFPNPRDFHACGRSRRRAAPPCPRTCGAFRRGLWRLFVFLVFARLVGYPAGSFARRLAGSLAFAAAAFFGAFFQIPGFYGDNSFHDTVAPFGFAFYIFFIYFIAHKTPLVNTPKTARRGEVFKVRLLLAAEKPGLGGGRHPAGRTAYA